LGTENVILKFLLRHPIACVFVLAVVGLGYAVVNKVQDSGQAQGRPSFARGGAASVNTAQVSEQMMSDRIESVGTAVANESVNLTPKVSDTISRVAFEDGDLVRAGDILIELTNASEAARLAEAQSNVDEAVRQFERLRTLTGDNLISATDLDAARTRAETAQARLEGVIVAMDDRLIRAPFSGVLGFRNVSEGSLVSPNTVITTLDDISVIKLDFTIAEVYLAQILSGQAVSAESIVYRGRKFEGVVQVVGSRIDPVTRSVQVRAVIDNADGVLRPGMLMTVSVALNAVRANVIPEQALVPRAGKQFVFLVGDENVANQVEVEIGRRRPGVVEILSGLSLGDQVVVEGLSSLRPGQSVRVLNAPVSAQGMPEQTPRESDARVSNT
jgi:membrane fusion protein (multidrug efflux system)